jgi:outer membrane protein assembly factor BamB
VKLRAAVVVGVLLLAVVGAVSLAAHPSQAPAAARSSSGARVAATLAPPHSTTPTASAAPTDGGPFPNGLLVADRANGRILAVDDAGRVLWQFPQPGSLIKGQQFSADDAFIAPDGKSIVANDEFHEVIDRIDIATGRIVWQYGHYGQPSSRTGYLHTPDDAYPLANGDIVVADIENCRILEIAPSKRVVRSWGHAGDCRDAPPRAYARPNGDTPLPDGGLLITEITGSRVVRLAADGHVVFDIHVPVAYPSDAQLDPNGNVVVADFSPLGQVVAVDPSTGQVVWRYRVARGPGRLDHPSLATPLANGDVSVNDDFRHRLVVIDPRTSRIVWQYGRTDVQGRAAGELDTPDGHQPLPPGVVF